MNQAFVVAAVPLSYSSSSLPLHPNKNRSIYTLQDIEPQYLVAHVRGCNIEGLARVVKG